MKLDREKRTVIVTGAGSGIGYALTLRLLEEGYPVSAWDIAAGGLASITHHRLSFYKLDVRDKRSIEQAVRQTLNVSGAIGGLVACAAIYKAKPFLALSESEWDQAFDINLKGFLLVCQAVLPAMRELGFGSIVLFSSMIARSGAVSGAHYAATKGGILGLARSLALEVARENIRVNVVSPGITDTPQPRGNMREEDMYAKGNGIPLKRIGSPEDMAEGALFLLREESSFMTGQDLRINGGALLF
ncbi:MULTISPECIES: SDR family NAD(P)-dependent oxidoreductase [unclassified Paenibacillus]|uniref:SDR family NAD(P)-dependent oxidoreductase n=1 Tax=unclassified Paenibacillus TaxID=185978 RepID=UPI001AEA7B45|nr:MULTISPECIES: SDR family NAD(P)-dependent oxidoreductase [unclassified Paenibacillus]MBP1154226.1 NAD(P)-dependent dehydrogenase (short-subunit alcohol dehydrogenase family) [Paenibacillus sp. PvP091]MBP1170389.1 NAD(P)-dependent dehydrogenase (short-subunit alcohol dehydrogenase family) [Paenibacillus sp. PvR098]MBP2441417.1 NAD(P)-dependent dehydrogenase (short-subunit alcohol dehydrogenase family) [Paenibacillus sp. PvP052]